MKAADIVKIEVAFILYIKRYQYIKFSIGNNAPNPNMIIDRRSFNITYNRLITD